MSDRRVERHYGFGAARVALSPQPHRYSQSIGAAMRDAGGDFYLSSLPPMIMAAFMCAALFVTVSEDRGYTDVEVMMIERGLHGLDDEIAEVPPVVEPPVKPPEPPVQKIAEKKPEPPPVVKKVKKVEPPKPPVQKIAAKKPKPRPVAKVKPKPKPKAKPKLELAALAPPPKAAAPTPPSRRAKRAAPAATLPRIDVMPAIAPALALEQVDEPQRSRRFAAVRQAPSRRPKADLGPPIVARALSAPPPEDAPVRSRRSAKRARADAPRRVAPIDFAAAAAPPPAAPGVAAPERRRKSPVPKPERARRAAPPPAIKPALLAAAPRSGARLEESSSRTAGRDRTQRNEGTRRKTDRSGGRGLRGVSLASLAVCLSDREEDALKRRLLAAVTTQRECVSPAGTYRFVETKNLNAFLMTIDRAPGRAEADRCVELSYALDCVGS